MPACAFVFFSPAAALWICDVLLRILPFCQGCAVLRYLHYYVFRRLHSDTSLLPPFKIYLFFLSSVPVKYMYCIFPEYRSMDTCCRFQKIYTLVKDYIFIPADFQQNRPKRHLLFTFAPAWRYRKDAAARTPYVFGRASISSSIILLS